MGSKVYEAPTLKAATRERAQQYEKLKEQFETLKKSFSKIVDNTEFQGHGADAIKGFYVGQIDVVDAWIQFIDLNVEFLNGIPGDMEDVDLSIDTVVHIPFLEDSVEPAGSMAKEMVADQQDALQRIFNGIADLVPLTVFYKDAFDNHMDQAEKERAQTIDKVNELDNRLSQEYASSQNQEQHIFALFSQLMEATRQGENITPLYFNAEAYHTSKAYQVHAETKGIATTSVKQGKNEQAPQIEIKNNEVQNPGDVAVVKTVEVFDEIEGKTNGTYYLYENGQIIWKHPTQTGKVVYKEVNEVPESRVGGVEELDSAFDGTGLAFLGWLHPKDVLKKSVKLVIKKGGKTTVKKLSKKEIKEVSAKRFVYDKKTGTWVDKNGKPLGNVKSIENANRLIPGTPGMVTGGNSNKLGKNMMEKMGLKRSTKWSGYQAQHIIPSEMANNPVIQKIGMNFDDSSNGIFLRIPDNDVSAMSRHRGYHSVYNEVVERALNKMDINQDVDSLQKEVYDLQKNLSKLQEKGLPLYPSQGATVELWERKLNQLKN